MNLSASVWPGLAARGQPARACGNCGALGRAKTVNGAHQYTSRTVPAAVDVLGLANPTASVLVNGVAATRKGEYFYRSVPAPNSSGPWFTTNSVQSLYGGASPETGTLFVPQTPEVFTPDPDGNLVRDGRWDYTWDGENRLVRMESLTNAPVPSRLRVEFGYDYQGRRIWKRVTSLSTGSVLPERKFVDEGWNLVAELSADLRLFKSFSWGLDLSGSLQGAGGVGGLLWVSHFLSGQVTSTDFAPYDGNGNVAALVGASSGALSARYEYGPFGEVVRATGHASAHQDDFNTVIQVKPERLHLRKKPSTAVASGLDASVSRFRELVPGRT